MIKVENGVVRLRGAAFELEAELAMIMRTMFEKELLTKRKVDNLFKLATMSDDELKEHAKMSEENIDKMKTLLKDMLDVLDRGGEEGDSFSNIFKDLDI